MYNLTYGKMHEVVTILKIMPNFNRSQFTRLIFEKIPMRIIERIANLHNSPTFIAGGAIRSFLMHKNILTKDFDIFTNNAVIKALDPAFKQLGADADLGPFGSVRWHFPGHREYIELMDINKFDNGLDIKTNTIEDVLLQFDITINSFAFDITSHALFYHPLSLLDLSENRIRLVRSDYPNDVCFKNSHLTRNAILWHRVLIYQNKTKFKFSDETMNWLNENLHFVDFTDEFIRIFAPPVNHKQIVYDFRKIYNLEKNDLPKNSRY